MDYRETEWVRAPPPAGTFCQRLGKIIYNPDDNSILGRTAKRWGIVLIFYAVFYTVLALLFGVCMGCLLFNLDDKKPTYTMEYSLIGVNPGVSYRPLPDIGVIVSFDLSMKPDNFTYIKQLDEFFDGYHIFPFRHRFSRGLVTLINNTSAHPYLSVGGAPINGLCLTRVLFTDVDTFWRQQTYRGDRWYFLKSGCNSVDNYGYPETPCFFIKINRIFGWTPDYYDNEYLPEDMPADLVNYINTLERDEAKQVWVSCSEEDLNQTLIEYPWGRGLPLNFFPYENDIDYRSPVVAVRLTPPVNQAVKIHCRVWAKNIIYNKSVKDASGYTPIQLLIKDKNKTEIEM